MHVERDGQLRRKAPARERRREPPRQQERPRAAADADDRGFDQRAPDEIRAPRAQRETDRRFALAIGRSRQHQTGEVGARQKQHQAGDTEQRAAEAGDRPAQERRHQARRRQHEPQAFVQLRMLAGELFGNRVQRRFGGGDGDAVAEPGHQKDVVRLTALEPVVPRLDVPDHRDRHPDIGHEQTLGAAEFRRHDAENRVRHPVDFHQAADDAGIAAECGAPIGGAQYNHRLLAGHAIVLRRERASERRSHAEHLEIVARDEQAPGSSGVVVDLEVHRREAQRSNARQHAVAIADVAVIRIRAGGKPGRARDRHQALRPLDRERREEERIDDAEDRGVGADAERQRQDRDGGEAWRPQQRAHRVAKVGAECGRARAGRGASR